MLDAVEGDELGSNDRLVVNHDRNSPMIRRRIPEDGLSCHDTIGVETDESVVAGHLGCRADGGGSLHMRCQDLPGLHLGIRELLILPGDLGQLIS